VDFRKTGEERDGAFRPVGGRLVSPGPVTETRPKHGGVDNAGVESDRGQPRRKFLREGGGQSLDSPLGGAIGSNVRRRRSSPARTEVDDDPPTGCDHGRKKG